MNEQMNEKPEQPQGVDANLIIQHLAARIADLEVQVAILKASATAPPETA